MSTDEYVPSDQNMRWQYVVNQMYDAEFIAAARTALPALLDALDAAEAAVQRVRVLHYPIAGIHGTIVCAHRHCVDDMQDQCEWPCPTARALDGDA